ncbi:MAG: DUF1553 domain-containing protein [Verrucomicrobia bacterium]|nr:DUF1553 domain-containing protein [Verrucomicrobiota bacterium]
MKTRSARPLYQYLPLVGFLIAVSSPAETSPRTKIDFNRDVRPILADNCFACHGPDKAKRKAGLRLDLRADATATLDSGGRAVVPGDPAASLILKLTAAENEEDRMPPKKTGKRLTSGQISILRQWVIEGAEFKAHWAYLSPERPPLPPVSDSTWGKNQIDRFILSRLDKEGLKPSPEAAKHALIRRVTLDLTGLPPTVSELDAFLADSSDNAYEQAVDRVLDSKAYGEKMAMHWLDLARFADSDGYHADVPRSMWQYRDYVIDSFNRNKPFDLFTLEQLAGDLLPNPAVEQRIATAFNRNGMSSTEGGADPDEYMNKYVTDRVNTFGTVFLGSSTACTECHDHKYDPFTQREYYQLYDFFNRIPERGLDNDPAPPFIKLPSSEQSERMAKYTNEIAQLETDRRKALDRQSDELSNNQRAWETAHRHRIEAGWQPLREITTSAHSGTQLRRLDDDSLLSSSPPVSGESYEVSGIFRGRELSALRLELVPDGSLPAGGSGRSTNGLSAISEIRLEATSANPAQEPPVAEIEWGGWSSLGPFKAASTKEIFEKGFLPETQPDLSKSYEGGTLKWKQQQGWKDGAAWDLSGENHVSFFHRKVISKSARFARFSAGGDGGFQVWINGQKVENGKVFRRVAAAPDDIVVLLQPGENTLLIRAHHGLGTYGFLFSPSKEPVSRAPVEFARVAADRSEKDSPSSALIDGKTDTAWRAEGRRTAILVARSPIPFSAGVRITARIQFAGDQPMGRFRLSASSSSGFAELAELPQSHQTTLFASPSENSPASRDALREFYREQFDAETKSVVTRLAAARKSAKDLDSQVPTLRVMEDMAQPRETHIRVRGDYRSKGEKVSAGVPAILPPLSSKENVSRLTLAKWLVDPQHPLLSRVTVNRYWANFFGTGIVKTGNEFGSQGELPSHPELLDWLAREFIEGGWNVKALQKKMVMSATYRQSSAVRPEHLDRDPANRLLARGPRQRLTAEMIRDCALDYAGLLDRKRAVGGPSVKPYQPPGLWEEKMFGGNKYEESKGPDLYRRSVYSLWKRTVLNPTLMTFDAPDRALCTEQRSQTCTPLQAFVTLNEKGFVEAARVMAERVVREGGQTLDDRLTYACKLVLSRPPSAQERQILAATHHEMFSAYQNDLTAALDLLSTGESKRAEDLNQLDLAAWAAVGNVLLNLDEAITKP